MNESSKIPVVVIPPSPAKFVLSPDNPWAPFNESMSRDERAKMAAITASRRNAYEAKQLPKIGERLI